MAVVPPTLSFYNQESQSSMFLNDSGHIAIFSSFGDNPNLFGSPGMSWDPYSSCGSAYSAGVSTFFGVPNPVSAEPLPDEPQLVYPTEEDIFLSSDTSEFLQQLHGCNQPVMHPNLVSTLKNMVTPDSPQSSFFEHPLHHYPQKDSSTESSLQGNVFLGQSQLLTTDSAPTSPADGSLTGQDMDVPVESDEVECRHEPPPLNMKRLEKFEDPADDNIEAAEVSVDLIQNRRPFRCGQEGCNKTFKNPQTMKMHHKTHYTDGSATSREGLAALPTLTPSLKAGQNKKIPSRCPKCRKTFVGLYELRRHYGRKHSEGEKPFACRKCAKKFYIEVDVRDHEKLCGEPIECKCGLKFAFKCNLVAHKKAHPACQDQSNHHTAANSNSSSNNQSSTSDEESSQSRGSSPPLPRGTKRQRVEEASSSSSITSHHMSCYTPPAPDFKGLPEVPIFKTDRYDFASLPFSKEGDSFWAPNMHYPSMNFTGLPMTSNLYGSFGGLEQLGSQIYSRKLQVGSSQNNFNNISAGQNPWG